MLRKGLIIVGVLIFVAVAFTLLRTGPTSPPTRVPARPDLRPELRAEGPPPLRDSLQDLEIADLRSEEPIPVDASATASLPPLGESDALVREGLELLSLPEAWIAQDHLLRRLAVFADNATRGEFSRRPSDFAKPEGRFRVVTRDGRLYSDPDNARRFDPYLDQLEAVDPAILARLLETLGPLIDEAFEELGSPMSGSDTLRAAIDRILEMPIRTDALELVQPNVLYEYADPDLETLPPLEKQLLRLGPANLRRLKAYLGALRTAL